MSERGLAFTRLSGAELNTDARTFPQRVIKASDGSFGVVCVVHVDKRELFQYIALNNFSELLKQFFELGIPRRLWYVTDINFNGLYHS